MKHIIALLLLIATGCGISKPPQDYRVAVDPTWFPFDLMGQESSVLGYTRDVIQEIAKMEDAPLSLMEVGSENLMFNLRRDQYKGILSAMQPYPFLMKEYDFSTSFLDTGPVLVVAADSKISSLKDLAGKVVALPEGTSSAVIAAQYPHVISRFYVSVPDVLLALHMKVIDAAVVEGLAAQKYCRDLYQGKLKVATVPLNNEGFRLVVLHGQADALLEVFDRGLAKLRDDHRLEKLQEKWGLR